MTVETELSFPNSSLNEEDLAPYVILEALLCNVFIEFNYSVVVENLRKRAVTKLWYVMKWKPSLSLFYQVYCSPSNLLYLK